MNANTFLSWSGKVSNAVAVVFYEYLPFIIQQANPFYSPYSIDKDKAWFGVIQSNLVNATTGIVFLTKENLSKENLTKEWLLIESGGLLSKGSLCVLLCDLTISELNDLQTIFKSFQVTRLTEREDMKQLFVRINKTISPDVNDHIIENTFDKYYNELNEAIQESLKKVNSSTEKAFKKYEARWQVEYVSNDGTFQGGELAHIDENGKYFLIDPSNNEKYYFQLQIVSEKDNVIKWQKLHTHDAKPTNSVHSVEILSNSNDDLVGEDTLNYKIRYKKLSG